MLPGSVTVTLNTPSPDSLSIGTCSGSPRVVPKKVAEEASRPAQVIWNVMAVLGVALEGSALAKALPGGLVTAAVADPAPTATSPTATELASTTLSPTETANCLIRRMNVLPPKAARRPYANQAPGAALRRAG